MAPRHRRELGKRLLTLVNRKRDISLRVCEKFEVSEAVLTVLGL